MRPQLAALLVVLTAMADLASAQQREPDHTIPWPTGESTDFRKLVRGDISGDGVPDAVLQVDDQCFYLFNPHIHQGIIPMAGTVNDIAMSTGDPTVPARLISARPDGVYRTRIQPVSGSPAFVTDCIDAGAMADARMIHVADLDDDGDDDILLVVEVGGVDMVKQLRAVGTSFVAGDTFAAPYTVRQMAAADYQGSYDTVEIVLHTDDGLYMYDIHGNPLDDLRSAVPGDWMDVFPGGATKDRIGWITTVPPMRLLLDVDDAGYDGPVYLNTLANDLAMTTSITACDHEAWGVYDAVLTTMTTSGAFVLENQGPGFGGQINYTLQTEPVGVTPALPVLAVGGDFDLDEKQDMLFASPNWPGLTFHRGDFGTQPNTTTSFSGVGYTIDCDTGTPTLQVLTPHLDAVAHMNADHLQVIAWVTNDATLQTLSPMAVGNWIFPISPNGLLETYAPPIDLMALDLPSGIGPLQASFGEVLYLECRFVKWDFVRGIPARIFGPTHLVAASGLEASIQQAEELEDPLDPQFVFVSSCPSGGAMPVEQGGIHQIFCLPVMAPGNPDQPPATLGAPVGPQQQ